jgi:hypothetical protein
MDNYDYPSTPDPYFPAGLAFFLYPLLMRFFRRRRSGGGDQLPLVSLFLFTRRPPPCDSR